VAAGVPHRREYGAYAQVALNWLIWFNGETVVTIPGATKVRQAQENAAAMDFKLGDEDLARIDELSRVFG
jgi:aryl-alcohol dehydrogenase-like predicted oxidoreductase